MSWIVLLGPQRLRPLLADVVDQMGITGTIAAVTAGWEEREREDDELAAHLGGRTVNLELNRRAEEALAADAELASARRAAQDEWREMRRLYNLRLAHQMAAVRELERRAGDRKRLDDELEDAFAAVRRLDRRYLEQISRLRSSFYDFWQTSSRPAFAPHRLELEAILEDAEALAIAGGHVGMLLDRLRLFDLVPLWGERPVFAWSAGAMVLAEQVVLFHDSPPQGAGYTEVLDFGLGVYRRILPLPHARRRLNLDSRRRVARLARRFSDLVCVPMDEGDHLRIEGVSLWAEAPLRRLTAAGEVLALEVEQA